MDHLLCPGYSPTQPTRNEMNGFSHPFQVSMDHIVLTNELKASDNIQELNVSCMVNHLGVEGRFCTEIGTFPRETTFRMASTK